jgi:hypothetical protein
MENSEISQLAPDCKRHGVGLVIQTLGKNISTNNLEQHSRNQKQKLNAEAAEINAETADIGWKNILKQEYSLRPLHQPLCSLR